MTRIQHFVSAIALLLFPFAAGAECRFSNGEISNPFETGCGDVILTYTENDNSGDNVALGYPVPVPVDSLTPVDGFRSYASLFARHQDLMLSNLEVSGSVQGQTVAGREIWAYRVGDTDDVTAYGAPEPAVIINGGIHAREWQSPEAVTGLFEQLVANKLDAGLGQYLIENLNVVLIPVHNVDGFIQTQDYHDRTTAHERQPRDGRMRRKNMSNPETSGAVDDDIATVEDNFFGVDLNRNNAVGFAQNNGSSGSTTSLVYRGTAPAMEPEIQALQQAAQLGPAERLRLYADVHSFTQIYFTPMTGNGRRDALTEALTARMRAVLGNKYRYGPDPVNGDIGTTADYFAETYQIPSWTLEIEPLGGGEDYGGTGASHSGFILPDSEAARMRDEVAAMFTLGFYRQAGPPAIHAVQIVDAQSGEVRYAAEWQAESATGRMLNVSVNKALLPGRGYRLWLAFDKPMRVRTVEGEVTDYPGQGVALTPTLALELELSLIAGIVITQTLDSSSGQWHEQPGGAPDGYLRYRDDAFSFTFTLDPAIVGSGPTPLILTVAAADFSGQALDANPATVADWRDGHWAGYEHTDGGDGDVGGTDCKIRPFAAPSGMADAAPPSGGGRCKPAGGPGGGGSVGFEILLLAAAAGFAMMRRRYQQY